MIAGASPNTNNLFANLKIHSCEGNPPEVSALYHPDWPNLPAAECPSISAAARSAAWRFSPRSGMPRRAIAAPIVCLRVRYRSHSRRAHQQPPRQLKTRSGRGMCIAVRPAAHLSSPIQASYWAGGSAEYAPILERPLVCCAILAAALAKLLFDNMLRSWRVSKVFSA
jgi:hypothetical protein